MNENIVLDGWPYLARRPEHPAGCGSALGLRFAENDRQAIEKARFLGSELNRRIQRACVDVSHPERIPGEFIGRILGTRCDETSFPRSAMPPTLDHVRQGRRLHESCGISMNFTGCRSAANFDRTPCK